MPGAHRSSAELTPRRRVGILKMLIVFVTYQILYFLAGQVYVALPKKSWVHGGMGAEKVRGSRALLRAAGRSQ